MSNKIAVLYIELPLSPGNFTRLAGRGISNCKGRAMQQNGWNNTVTSRDEQRRQKRLAVLTTGARLFNKHGFDRTTLDDIAGELNVSKRTLYYYVKSKEEILFQCNQLGIEFFSDILVRCADKKLPVLERIGIFLRGYADLMSDDLGACLILSRNIPMLEPNRSVLREGQRSLDKVLRDLIAEGIDDGKIVPGDPKLTTAAIFGAFNWIPHWNTSERQVPHRDIAEHYIQLFVDGLRRPETR